MQSTVSSATGKMAVTASPRGPSAGLHARAGASPHPRASRSPSVARLPAVSTNTNPTLALASSMGSSFLGSSSVFKTPLRPKAVHSRGGPVHVAAYSYRGRRGGSAGVSVLERLVASLPYLLPLMGALRYGRFFFVEFPQFSGALLQGLMPLIKLYSSIPMAGFIFFLALYLGVVNNDRFSRFVRFNTLQAILLDICLSLPAIIEWIIRPPAYGLGLKIYMTSCNAIWLCVFGCVVYAMVSCFMGEKANLPLLGDAADARLP